MVHPAEYFIKYLLVVSVGADHDSINSTLELYGVSAVSREALAEYRAEVSSPPQDFRPWDKQHRPSSSWLRKKKLFSLVHPDQGTMEMKEKILQHPRTREKVERMILGNVPAREGSLRLTKLGVLVGEMAISEYKHYFWNTDLLGISDWVTYFRDDSTERTSPVRTAYSTALLAGPDVALYRLGVRRQIDSKRIMLEVQTELYHTFLETRELPLSAKKVEMLSSLSRSLARIDERVQAGDTALQETLKKFEKFKVLQTGSKPPSLLDLAPTGSISNKSRNEILTSG